MGLEYWAVNKEHNQKMNKAKARMFKLMSDNTLKDQHKKYTI